MGLVSARSGSRYCSAPPDSDSLSKSGMSAGSTGSWGGVYRGAGEWRRGAASEWAKTSHGTTQRPTLTQVGLRGVGRVLHVYILYMNIHAENNICNTQEHRSEHRGVAFAQNNVQVSNETSTKQSHDIRHRVLCKKYETVSPSRGCNYT